MASPSAAVFTYNPTTPNLTDDIQWITAYLKIHVLSEPSWRYAYYLWFLIAFIFVIFSLLHLSGSRKGVIGAYWSKWSLRRRTWRKKHSLAIARINKQPHRQPLSLPSNAQILTLVILLIATIALSVVGPDYIAPNAKFYQFYRRDSNTIVVQGPQFTIQKAWWTAGGRTGLIAFALLPLCVLFVLKAPPFALFAMPVLSQIYCDKLSWLHRWSGRLIWLMSVIHAALWTVQVSLDRRESTGERALVYAWKMTRFRFAWTALGLLTLIVIMSVNPIRRDYYKTFRFGHVLLVPSFLITAALHHPPVWWWCWAALGLWVGERLWRSTWWLSNNGYLGKQSPSSPSDTLFDADMQDRKKSSWMSKSPPSSSADSPSFPLLPSQQSYFPRGAKYDSLPGEEDSSYPPNILSAAHQSLSPSISSAREPRVPLYLPPPGFVHAELLSGRTIRLRFLSSGAVCWAPGQHFLINIPFLSKLTSHPFTTASVCDEQGSDEGRVISFLIRAKNGWTKDLWDAVVTLMTFGGKHPRGQGPPEGSKLPKQGVLMRMNVDGPFGSSIRARWGDHSTVLIVAGGSGVSFGLSVLEYVCLCMAGRDGKYLGGRSGGYGKPGYRTTRVRFVWLVREFSHIQWCATTLRRCMEMIPSPGLQIDIFVTKFKPTPSKGLSDAPRPTSSYSNPPSHSRDNSADSLHGGHQVYHHKEGTGDSIDSIEPTRSYVDLSQTSEEHMDSAHHRVERVLGIYGPDHENHILDLTNFEGDNDTALPGEDALNHAVNRQGTIRRAKTRRANKATAAAKQRLRDRHSTDGAVHPKGPRPAHLRNLSSESTGSTDELLSYASPPSASFNSRLSVTLESDQDSPGVRFSDSPRQPEVTVVTPEVSQHGHTEEPLNSWDSRDDTASIHSLIQMPQTGTGAYGEEIKLQVGDQEMRDIYVMSEHALPGKPKLDRIISDEMKISHGSMIIGTCGPTTLNAMLRKIIAAKIDPGRVRRGDMRGMIELVSEEFEY